MTDNIYPNALHADSTEPIQEDTNQETSLEYPQETTLDTGKPILLIVEDNEEIQKYIAESFADSFEVLTAYNGEEGKQQALSRIPDIVVSDIMMPVMNGYEAAKMIRSLDREDAKVIPIIAMTANAFTEDKMRAKEAGMDEHIAKPVDGKLLVKAINELVKHNQEKL